MKFNTKTIHAGVEPDPTTGAIMTPIFQTSTYVQSAPGEHQGYEYARTQNPTRDVLQNNLAALENGKHGLVFSSGLAATDVIIKTLNPGDEVISTNDLYGGTYRLFRTGFEKYGMKFHFKDLRNADDIDPLLNDKTKFIWIETPTNPMLNIVDIEAIVKKVKGKGIKVIVDNTFASPYLQRPLDLGADIVVHSATKYLGGHSDVVMGAIVTSDTEMYEQFKFIQNAAGAVSGPQDCFLVIRGIKTLHLRVQRACENAAQIAEFLKTQDAVNNVYWPGFKDHPGHEIAKRQMDDFGGMVSFDLKDDSIAAANSILTKTNLFALAESLGGVESLIGHPASMTHGSIPLEERKKTGVLDSLIRLSVGVEDGDDLVADLKGAF